jgi:DNA polymerase III sliding clamp (beta) subunit (PCNA family)
VSTARVNREDFLGRLQSVQAGLSSKELLEQSSCFCFRDGEILSFNDEVACRTKSGLLKKFTGAVKAKPLLDLLGKMKEETIELEEGDGELLVIASPSSKGGIRMEAEVLLAIETVEPPGEWKPLPDDFDDAVELTSACVGTDENSFALTCVHFAPSFLEGCDNSQLTRFKIKVPFASDCMIRQKSLAHIIALGMTECSESESWLHFRNPAGLIFSCRRYSDPHYPDFSAVLKGEKGIKALLPGGMTESVERAGLFATGDGNDNRVRVELRGKQMRLRGEGSSGWYSEVKRTKYEGPPLTFYISPKILIEIAKRNNEVEISPKRLVVNGGKFTYIACLFQEERDNKGSKANDDSAE